MPTIKLGAIRQEALLPIRFKMPDGKYAQLQDYLAFFNETHHSAVDLQTLLPHLIDSFLSEDRAFARWRTDRQIPTAASPTRPAKHTSQTPQMPDLPQGKN